MEIGGNTNQPSGTNKSNKTVRKSREKSYNELSNPRSIAEVDEEYNVDQHLPSNHNRIKSEPPNKLSSKYQDIYNEHGSARKPH